MAIQINADVTTSDGFVVRPFAFLSIQLYEPFSRSLIAYYKDQAAFKAGAAPINIPSLPTLANCELTSQQFWGAELATLLTNAAVAEIEKVTGQGTCVIVQQISATNNELKK